MPSSHPSPCKASFNGALRRFLMTRPAKWCDFEAKLRTIFSIPEETLIDVQYKDEEGDVIFLNTDSELEDVFSMHAIFSQLAPVKFEVSLREQEDISVLELATNTSSTRAGSIVGDLAQERSVTIVDEHVDTPLLRPINSPQQSATIQDNDSDDGSLIDFEDAAEHSSTTPSNTALHISYFTQGLLEETLRHEQEMAERSKLEAPHFPSSLAVPCEIVPVVASSGTEENTLIQPAITNEKDVEVNNTSEAMKISRPPSPLVEQFEALHMENAPEVMHSIVASAIEQHAQEMEMAMAASTHTDNSAENVNHCDPAEPEILGADTRSSSTSTPFNDRALIEQFQLLIREFQHVIQNNPQLVQLAGGIMSNILANVKVNFEAFASFLQEAATQAAANAQEAATQAAASAQEAAAQAAANAHVAADEAARCCPFTSAGENPFQTHSFFTSRRGDRCSRRRGGRHSDSGSANEAANCTEKGPASEPEDPFSGTHRPYHRHHHGEHSGRGGPGGHGRGGFFGRGGHHEWKFGPFSVPIPPMVPMAPMAPVPPMPHMPPMPPMFHSPHIPPVPPCPPVPSHPFFGGRSGDASSTGVPGSGLSPFSRGFPFNNGCPGRKDYEFHFKGGRPNLGDTEASKNPFCGGPSRSEDPTRAGQQQGESSSSSTMPGSFPQNPPAMTESDNGWKWSKLSGTDNGGRPRFGWVFMGNESGEENTEPTPLYTVSDEEMGTSAETPAQTELPGYGRGESFFGRGGHGGFGFGPFRGRGRGGASSHFHPHHSGHHGGPHDVEHGHPGLHRHQSYSHHHHHRRRRSGSKSGDEGAAESNGEEKLKRRQTIHEQRDAMIQARRENLQDQRQMFIQQREAAQLRQAQLQQRNTPEAQGAATAPVATATATTAPVAITPVAATPVATTPVAMSPAPATPVATSTTAPVATSTTAPVATATPVGAGSLAGIWPTPAQEAPATPTTIPGGFPTTRAAAAEVNDVPMIDVGDFQEQLKILIGMGFADNEELRTVLHDFGGEIEAVVEFMITTNRQ